MIGYVGERARRRKRNFITIIIFIMLISMVYYFVPLTKINDNLPSETLLPTEKEINYPDSKPTIDEIELQIYDRDQKIIFRDNQIKKLNNRIDILTLKNDTLMKDKSLLNNLNKENDINIKNLKKYNDSINKIEEEKSILLKDLDKIINQNTKLKEENKKITNDKYKLDNFIIDYGNKIKKLEIIIEEQELIIKILKDTTLHG